VRSREEQVDRRLRKHRREGGRRREGAVTASQPWQGEEPAAGAQGRRREETLPDTMFGGIISCVFLQP
jgi:hypothetical protein